MPRPALLLACLIGSCQLTGTLYEKRVEPECRAGDRARLCLCDDDRRGVAECFGPGDSGPCDCAGRPPGRGVVELAMGGLSTCAVLDDGRVTCWGENADGQLATGTDRPESQPVATLVTPDVEQLALGGDDQSGYGCALLQDSGVQCWGKNDRGQLGDGTKESTFEPVDLELPAAVHVAAGASHTCAVTRDGDALCWGDNAHQQLGYLTASREGSPTPTAVDGALELASVAAGRYHGCAIDTSGDVLCWGEDAHGQLGDGGERARLEPMRVDGLANARQLALGAEHACALDADHEVRCWGRNHRGQLGDGTTIDRRTPVRVVGLPEITAIAAGWNHTCALDRGGAVRCWGEGADGQLGTGNTIGSSSPVDVIELEGARAIAAALHSSCAVLEDGGVKCWGDNRRGQLGDGSETDRAAPVSVRWLDAPLVTHGDGADDAGAM